MSAGEAALNKGRTWLSGKLDPHNQPQRRPGARFEQFQAWLNKLELSESIKRDLKVMLVLAVLVALGPRAVGHFGVIAVLAWIGVAWAIGLMASKRWEMATLVMGVIWAVGVGGLVLNTLTEVELLLIPIMLPLLLALAMAIFVVRPVLYVPMLIAGALVWFSPELKGLTGTAIGFAGSFVTFVILGYLAFRLSLKFKGILYMEVLTGLTLLAYDFIIVWLGGEDGIFLDNAQQVGPVYVEWTVAAGLTLLAGSTFLCVWQSVLEKPGDAVKESLNRQEVYARLYQLQAVALRHVQGEGVFTGGGKHLREDALRAVGMAPYEAKTLRDDADVADSYRAYVRDEQLKALQEAIEDGKRPAKLDNTWEIGEIDRIEDVTVELLTQSGITVEEAYQMQRPDPGEVETTLDQLFNVEDKVVVDGDPELYIPAVKAATGKGRRELRWQMIDKARVLAYNLVRFENILRDAQDDPEQPNPAVPAGKNKYRLDRKVVAEMGLDPGRLHHVYGFKADRIV